MTKNDAEVGIEVNGSALLLNFGSEQTYGFAGDFGDFDRHDGEFRRANTAIFKEIVQEAIHFDCRFLDSA